MLCKNDNGHVHRRCHAYQNRCIQPRHCHSSMLLPPTRHEDIVCTLVHLLLPTLVVEENPDRGIGGRSRTVPLAASVRRILEQIHNDFSSKKGVRLMFSHIVAGLSASSICGHDHGVKHFVASTRAVLFRQVGCGECIEVVGIPALRCQVCDEQSYDLSLLAHIESILCRRVQRGNVRTSYLFEQLAAELTTDSLF